MAIMSNRYTSLMFCVSIGFAVFFPTSYNGVINNLFVPIIIILSSSVFVTYALFKNCLIVTNLIIFKLFFCLLILFTILSPFEEFTPGALFPYLAMAVVLSVDLRDLDFNIAHKFFIFVSILLVVIGYGIVFDLGLVIDFVFFNYSAYYDELLTHMITWNNKPVSVFGTHSLSAFVYFFFALIFFKLGLVFFGVKSVLHFLCAGLFFCLILYLKSFSAYALAAIFCCLIFLTIDGKLRLYCLAAVLVFASVSIYVVDLSSFYDQLATTFSSSGNGLNGRYFGSGSRLDGSFEFLFENFYLIGVGLTSGPQLSFGDSFLTDYVIRTSFLGYFLVVIALSNYLNVSFNGKPVVYVVLFLIFLGDLGFPLLTNYRVIFLIPLLICMWRFSDSIEKKKNFNEK